MKFFYNKSKYALIFMIVLSLLIQIAGPIQRAYAISEDEKEIEELQIEEVKEPQVEEKTEEVEETPKEEPQNEEKQEQKEEEYKNVGNKEPEAKEEEKPKVEERNIEEKSKEEEKTDEIDKSMKEKDENNENEKIDEEDKEMQKTVKLASAKLFKTDDKGHKLAGAKFGIYKKSDTNFENVIQVQTSNNSGYLKFEDLPLGKYVVKEIQAPTGYKLSNQTLEVELKKNGEVKNLGKFKNTKEKLGKIIFIKQNEKGHALSGAKFGIYKKSDTNFENLIEEQTSDKYGVVKFKNLPFGEYRIKELNAPTGYKLLEKILKVDINTAHGYIDLGCIINIKEEVGHVEFIKKDENKKKLAGAIFGIYNASDTNFENIVQEQTSGSNGLVRFINLPLGEYVIKEIHAPTGYELSDQTLEVKNK